MIDKKTDGQWCTPLATFSAVVMPGYQIEIPAAVRIPLGIGINDVVEVAYIGSDDNEEVTVYHTVVGMRHRFGLKKILAAPTGIDVKDVIVVGILSVYHSRADGLVVVFDEGIPPELYLGED